MVTLCQVSFGCNNPGYYSCDDCGHLTCGMHTPRKRGVHRSGWRTMCTDCERELDARIRERDEASKRSTEQFLALVVILVGIVVAYLYLGITGAILVILTVAAIVVAGILMARRQR